MKKQFEESPAPTRVEMGQQTELRCVAPIGVPPPRIYWLQGGQPLQTDTSVIVSTDGHLLIGEARAQDTNNYTCVAENIAAKRMSAPVQLTVYGKLNCTVHLWTTGFLSGAMGRSKLNHLLLF